jgi:uncharacterized membrane protein
MSLKNLQDMMTREKRKRERIKATQNFVAGMSVAIAMAVATGVLIAIRIRKGDKNMIIDSKIAASIEDTAQKKETSIKNSTIRQKNDADHVIKVLRRVLGLNPEN